MAAILLPITGRGRHCAVFADVLCQAIHVHSLDGDDTQRVALHLQVFPVAFILVGIPQVSFRTRIIVTLLRQPLVFYRAVHQVDGFVTYTQQAAPLEKALAALYANVVAEVGLPKHHAHVEWLAIRHPWPRQVAQRQHLSLGKVAVLEEYATRLGIANVEHQVNVDWRYAVHIRVEQAHVHPRQQAQECNQVGIICNMLVAAAVITDCAAVDAQKLSEVIRLRRRYGYLIATQVGSLRKEEIQQRISHVADGVILVRLGIFAA